MLGSKDNDLSWTRTVGAKTLDMCQQHVGIGLYTDSDNQHMLSDIVFKRHSNIPFLPHRKLTAY